MGDDGESGLPGFVLGILELGTLELGEPIVVSILFEGGEDFTMFILVPNEVSECLTLNVPGLYSLGVFDDVGVFGVFGVFGDAGDFGDVASV